MFLRKKLDIGYKKSTWIWYETADMNHG